LNNQLYGGPAAVLAVLQQQMQQSQLLGGGAALQGLPPVQPAASQQQPVMLGVNQPTPLALPNPDPTGNQAPAAPDIYAGDQ
jgi:hypothetical protein